MWTYQNQLTQTLLETKGCATATPTTLGGATQSELKV